jgi:hypothetical protein
LGGHPCRTKDSKCHSQSPVLSHKEYFLVENLLLTAVKTQPA